jgi:predicted P-loop ATPase
MQTVKSNSENESKLNVVMNGIHEYIMSHYLLHYNVLDDQYEIKERSSHAPFRILDEREENSLTMELLNAGVNCFDRDVHRYIHSKAVAEYHPLLDYLSRLPKWDGKDRVEELASRVSSEPFWQKIFHRWLLGVVAQWMGKNKLHSNCLTPILISHKQGRKKSSFCKCLLPRSLRRYYTDICDITSRSNVHGMLPKFALINLDEMDRLGPSKMASLKNILQVSEVRMKLPYQTGYVMLQRIASFIATSNFSELLTDPSGGRRFFPIELKGIIGRLNITYSQLYAQLKEELQKGMRYWLSLTEENQLLKRNAAYVRRPYEETLFFECFRLPKDGEESIKLPLHRIYEILRKKSAAVMRDIALGSFGQHLAMIGVQKETSQYGNLYKVCLKNSLE